MLFCVTQGIKILPKKILSRNYLCLVSRQVFFYWILNKQLRIKWTLFPLLSLYSFPFHRYVHIYHIENSILFKFLFFNHTALVSVLAFWGTKMFILDNFIYVIIVISFPFLISIIFSSQIAFHYSWIMKNINKNLNALFFVMYALQISAHFFDVLFWFYFCQGKRN